MNRILTSALLAAGAVVFGSSTAIAQTAAGLATSITTDYVTAAGTAGSLVGTGSGEFFFTGAQTAGANGAQSTLCLGDVSVLDSTTGCFLGSEAVAITRLPNSGTVIGESTLEEISATADSTNANVTVTFSGD